jgi:TolB protein
MEGENAAILGRSSWWAQPGAPEASSAPPGLLEPESLVVLPHLESEPFTLPGAETVMFDWFPDGRRVLASLATRQGRHALVRFRTDEKNLPVEPVLAADARTIAAEHPAVSPDGRTVAFELWLLASGEKRTLLGIGTIPADAQTPIVFRTATDSAKAKLVVAGDARDPRWSPDGSKLLYSMVGPRGLTDLHVVGSDGSNPVNLTKGVGDNTDAAWSPAKR